MCQKGLLPSHSDNGLNEQIADVVRRWHQLYQSTLLSQNYQRGDALSKGKFISLEETVTIYRQRLYDISWLMRNLNEYVAREGNRRVAEAVCKRYVNLNELLCFYQYS